MSTKITYSQVTGTPSLATVATSGKYDDLLSKPVLFSGAYGDLTGRPSLATVATSGKYDDLLSKPTLFSGKYSDLTGTPTLFSGAYGDLSGRPNLATVATSGKYDDLLSKPTFPSLVAQVTVDPVPAGFFSTVNFTMPVHIGNAVPTVTGIPYYVYYVGQSSICVFEPLPANLGNSVDGAGAGTPRNLSLTVSWTNDSGTLGAWPYSFTLNLWA